MGRMSDDNPNEFHDMEVLHRFGEVSSRGIVNGIDQCICLLEQSDGFYRQTIEISQSVEQLMNQLDEVGHLKNKYQSKIEGEGEVINELLVSIDATEKKKQQNLKVLNDVEQNQDRFNDNI